jgi:hypothetical protein
MAKDEERDFRLRPRRPPARNERAAWATACKIIMHHARTTSRRLRTSAGKGSGPSRIRPYSQRCAHPMVWTHRSFWVLPILLALILGLLSALVAHTRLRKVYHERFPESRRERLFLASIGFFTTVILVRALTELIRHDIGPFHDVSMHGRHIHHLVWGILLLMLVGYSWLMEIGTGAPSSSRWMGRLCSMVFGVAAALTLDEFALWLNLRDVYWEREGRESFEAMGGFGSLLAIGIFGQPLFNCSRMARRERRSSSTCSMYAHVAPVGQRCTAHRVCAWARCDEAILKRQRPNRGPKTALNAS